MHFLCLHGAGTNNSIFEAQISALRYELGGNHTYDFAEGVVRQPKAAAIETLTTIEDDYYGYYDPCDPASFREALSHLRRYIDTDGPFDGVIAFSQGTALASMLIAEWFSGQGGGGDTRLSKPPFRCVIFFSGCPPSVEIGKMMLANNKRAIRIPSAHIWGSNDSVIDPASAAELCQYFEPSIEHIYVHPGGHEIPGSRDIFSLIDSVNVIRRLLASLG